MYLETQIDKIQKYIDHLILIYLRSEDTLTARKIYDTEQYKPNSTPVKAEIKPDSHNIKTHDTAWEKEFIDGDNKYCTASMHVDSNGITYINVRWLYLNTLSCVAYAALYKDEEKSKYQAFDPESNDEDCYNDIISRYFTKDQKVVVEKYIESVFCDVCEPEVTPGDHHNTLSIKFLEYCRIHMYMCADGTKQIKTTWYNFNKNVIAEMKSDKDVIKYYGSDYYKMKMDQYTDIISNQYSKEQREVVAKYFSHLESIYLDSDDNMTPKEIFSTKKYVPNSDHDKEHAKLQEEYSTTTSSIQHDNPYKELSIPCFEYNDSFDMLLISFSDYCRIDVFENNETKYLKICWFDTDGNNVVDMCMSNNHGTTSYINFISNTHVSPESYSKWVVANYTEEQINTIDKYIQHFKGLYLYPKSVLTAKDILDSKSYLPSEIKEAMKPLTNSGGYVNIRAHEQVKDPKDIANGVRKSTPATTFAISSTPHMPQNQIKVNFDKKGCTDEQHTLEFTDGDFIYCKMRVRVDNEKKYLDIKWFDQPESFGILEANFSENKDDTRYYDYRTSRDSTTVKCYYEIMCDMFSKEQIAEVKKYFIHYVDIFLRSEKYRGNLPSLPLSFRYWE